MEQDRNNTAAVLTTVAAKGYVDGYQQANEQERVYQRFYRKAARDSMSELDAAIFGEKADRRSRLAMAMAVAAGKTSPVLGNVEVPAGTTVVAGGDAE